MRVADVRLIVRVRPQFIEVEDGAFAKIARTSALRTAWRRSIGMALYRGWASGSGARCPAVQSLP
jgi:hypothetical protein